MPAPYASIVLPRDTSLAPSGGSTNLTTAQRDALSLPRDKSLKPASKTGQNNLALSYILPISNQTKVTATNPNAISRTTRNRI